MTVGLLATVEDRIEMLPLALRRRALKTLDLKPGSPEFNRRCAPYHWEIELLRGGAAWMPPPSGKIDRLCARIREDIERICGERE